MSWPFDTLQPLKYGVILADPAFPMTDVAFHSVRVHAGCGAAAAALARGFAAPSGPPLSP